MSKPKIAILVPVCSRNQKYNDISTTPFYKKFLPNFVNTIEDSLYEYKIYLGIDDDDTFYINHISKFLQEPRIRIIILNHCQHNPVRAWNILFHQAITDNYEYFFQIGDDVSLFTKGWTTAFINTLKKQCNIGTIAPCEPMNYHGRIQENKPIVNENNFVHRTHFQIFGFFFFPEIINWHCDDWITFVYGDYAKMLTEFLVDNSIKGNRYQIIPCQKIEEYVNIGKKIFQNYFEKNINNLKL